MATDEIRHVISIEAEFSKVQTQLRTLEGNFNSSFNRIGTTAKNLAGLLGAGLGLVALTGFLKSSFDEFENQERAVASLNQTLQSTGQNVKGYSEFLQKQASALQQVTTFGDDAIVGVQQQLIAFGAAGSQMERLTKATLDLAAGMGIDLKSAAQLVGKAVAGEFGTFSRYGIIVDDNASKSEKFNQVLRQIEERFGGQAQAQANTFTGAIKQLGNAWGEAKEAVAGYIASFDILTRMLKGFTQLLANPQGFKLSAELEVVNRQIEAIDQTIQKTQGNQGVRGFLDNLLIDQARLQERRAELVRRANELKAELTASETITPPGNLPGGRALSVIDPAAAKKLADEMRKLSDESFKGLIDQIEAFDEKGVKASEGMLTVFAELNKLGLTPIEQQIAQINERFDELIAKTAAFGEATKQNVQPFIEDLNFFRGQELLKLEPDVDLVDNPPRDQREKEPDQYFREGLAESRIRRNSRRPGNPNRLSRRHHGHSRHRHGLRQPRPERRDFTRGHGV